MEGQLAGGNDDGVLMYGYSKSLCEEFGTCSKSEHDLLRLLNFGRDLLHAQGKNCAQLWNLVGSIEDANILRLLNLGHNLLQAQGENCAQLRDLVGLIEVLTEKEMLYRNQQDELSSLQKLMKEQLDRIHKLTSVNEQQQQENNRFLTEK